MKLNDTQQQFLAQNAEQLPALLQLAVNIRAEFLEMRATEGNTVAVLTAYKSIDSIHETTFAHNTQQPISCFNCTAAYCCHQSVDICEAEAALIAQYCKEQKIKIPRKHLQKQLAHNRDNIAFVDCSACVFLKNNRCSIYYVRPAACRIHHVATPFEECNTKQHKHQKICFVNNSAAIMIREVLFAEGGKVDRMPRLLLKYSQ